MYADFWATLPATKTRPCSTRCCAASVVGANPRLTSDTSNRRRSVRTIPLTSCCGTPTYEQPVRPREPPNVRQGGLLRPRAYRLGVAADRLLLNRPPDEPCLQLLALRRQRRLAPCLCFSRQSPWRGRQLARRGTRQRVEGRAEPLRHAHVLGHHSGVGVLVLRRSSSPG